jgi:enterochelin esterase-like enzyme
MIIYCLLYLKNRRWLVPLALCLAALLLPACDPYRPAAPTTPTALAVTVLPTAIPSHTPTKTPLPSPTPLPSATPPPTATPFVCTEQTGSIVELSFESITAKTELPYRVYLPPCYLDSGKRYPFVLLMHGADQDERFWLEALAINKALETGLTLRALPPMILLMPRGGSLANSDIFNPNRSFEKVIMSELLPELEKNFCTWNDREGRAIAGISRGGMWAYLIGLRHPDSFGAVAGHSPYFDTDYPPQPDYNPLALIRNAQFAPAMQPRFWLDVGDQDGGRATIEQAVEAFRTRGINIDYTLNLRGEHTAAYWAKHSAEYLAFYGQNWPKTLADLPNCE